MGSFSSGTFPAKPTLSVHSTNRLLVIIRWNGDRCLSSNYQLIHNGVKIRTPDGRNKRWLRGRVFRFPNQTLHLLTIPDQILIHGSPRFGRHPAIAPHWSCRLVFFLIKTRVALQRRGIHLSCRREPCVFGQSHCVCKRRNAYLSVWAARERRLGLQKRTDK